MTFCYCFRLPCRTSGLDLEYPCLALYVVRVCVGALCRLCPVAPPGVRIRIRVAFRPVVAALVHTAACSAVVAAPCEGRLVGTVVCYRKSRCCRCRQREFGGSPCGCRFLLALDLRLNFHIRERTACRQIKRVTRGLFADF